MFTTLYLKKLGLRESAPETDFPFWQSRLEKMFGAPIANRASPEDAKDILQLHIEYCDQLEIAFRKKTSIPPNAILELLLDCNVGSGQRLLDLLQILRSKNGAEEAEKSATQFLRRYFCEHNHNFSQLLETQLSNLAWGAHPLRSGNHPISYRKSEGTYTECQDDRPRQIFSRANKAINHAAFGDIDFLTNDQNSDLVSAAMNSTIETNLLHAVSYSGNKACLDFLIKQPDNIAQALYKRSGEQSSPAGYAAISRSLYCLRKTLALSTRAGYPPSDELFGRNAPLEIILFQQNLPAFYYLLEWLKHNKLERLASVWMNSSSHLQALISEPISGAMFHLLTKYIDINENNPLLSNHDDTQPLPFTTACLIESHKEKLALQKEASTALSRR